MAVPAGAELVLEGIRVVASLLYILVGAIVLRRDVERETQLAQWAFAAWWFGLALVGVMSIPGGLGVNYADTGLNAVRLFIYAVFGILVVALAGLVYSLLYIYTGVRRTWIPVAALYAGLMVFLVYLIEAFGPYVGVAAGEEAMSLLFRTEHPPWLTMLFGLALVVPPIIAAGAFFLLYFRIEEPLRRYRIALVSIGIVLWFGYSLVSSILRFVTGGQGQSLVGQAVGQGLGLLAGILVLLAYAPPRMIRRRLEAGGSRGVAG